jgi:hypothetical protein
MPSFAGQLFRGFNVRELLGCGIRELVEPVVFGIGLTAGERRRHRLETYPRVLRRVSVRGSIPGAPSETFLAP